jgi:hypothetical protein
MRDQQRIPSFHVFCNAPQGWGLLAALALALTVALRFVWM